MQRLPFPPVVLGSLILLTISLLFSSCASMLNKGKSTVLVQSDPPGASVYREGSSVGTTPYQYAYDPTHGKETVLELRKPGYQVSELKLRPKQDAMVLFADAFLLHIPYIIDHKSPHLYKFPVNECTVTLINEIPTDLTTYALPVTGVEMSDISGIGKLNGRPNRTGEDDILSSFNSENERMMAVVNGARGGYLDAQFVRIGTSNATQQLQRSKFHLKPIVRSVSVDLDLRKRRYYGPVQMEIDWRFFSGVVQDSLLFSVPLKYNYQAVGERRSNLLLNALEAAVNGLASDPDLHAMLGKAYGAGVQLSKGETVDLTSPKTIEFDDRREMLSKLVQGVVTVVLDDGHGSGFIISNQGHIITNEHVVGSRAKVQIKLEQGISLEGTVLKTNPDLDLALVKVTATDLPALALGNDKDLLIGEEVFAIGTPMDQALGQSVSRGILSGKRDIEGRLWLQTDVSINPGNSGGPLLDENGRVIGVTTMKISSTGVEGLGFAVPISVALEMLNINIAGR